ncbi:hypothetical protein NDU88_006478 [Pleurodeles waltl]|uniref:Uncharacterized protein n=1 Tax=Pleurodeles waltl TaxID=8319 RepID=A0AAV7SPS4_PLEWA|nr:hypothetical protein NDU88_006478 [Pleurodeles waltl]
MSAKAGFYRQELNKTVWEVPERYTNLTPVGSGAYTSGIKETSSGAAEAKREKRVRDGTRGKESRGGGLEARVRAAGPEDGRRVRGCRRWWKC